MQFMAYNKRTRASGKPNWKDIRVAPLPSRVISATNTVFVSAVKLHTPSENGGVTRSACDCIEPQLVELNATVYSKELP